MNDQFTTSKGFKVIPLNSLSEVNRLFNSPGICDRCNNAVFSGMYIAAMNRCFCDSCFEKWHSKATYFPEDAKAENKNFQFYHYRAIQLGIIKKG